jgi:MFS family permease
MRTFFIVWLGQVVSLLGSKLTEFALGFWILEQTYRGTGTITQFALTILLIYLPKVIVSPLAGVLIDRWNRRNAMIMSDLATGLITLGIMFLALSNRLSVWHIYVAVTITSSFNAFQLPAYTAAIAQIVPKKDFSRANGMVQASNAAARIAAPFIAGILIKSIGLAGVLCLDFMTFAVAIITLISVKFPPVKRFSKTKQPPLLDRLFVETISGWNYITHRPQLLRLLSFIAISYFTTGMLEVVLWPLLYQPNSTEQLGLVLSIGGCGMLLGSVLMTLWTGPKNRVQTIIGFVGLQGIIVLLGGLRISVFVLAIGIFGYLFSQPIIVSCNQAVWQSKVPSRLQGRVFALQQTLERALAIIAYLCAGPLVDNVLNPLMKEGGWLATRLSGTIRTSPHMGDGIPLLLVGLGILNIAIVAIAFRQPYLRNLERDLPDRNKFDLDRDNSALESREPVRSS